MIGLTKRREKRKKPFIIVALNIFLSINREKEIFDISERSTKYLN